MRLIDPGPGELLDRETILIMKIEAALEANKPADHFQHELTQIRARLDVFRVLIDADKWAMWWEELMGINFLIWTAIDRLRATEKEDHETAARWGREALRTNDERAAMIHKINEECGVAGGPEKIR